MLALKDILPAVFSNLQSPARRERTELLKSWSEIIGARFAPHTEPRLGKNGRLWVRVDRSALACELHQKYSPSILKRTQALLGEREVTSVRFLVGDISHA